MSDSWRDSEGQVIDGQFPLVKFKAATDHSVVFSTLRGKDKNEKAAIKFIQADASNADDQLARWRHAAQLSHPNLIKVYESGRCQLAGLDLLYVVMEQTQENLGEFLPQRALSPDETHDMLEPFVDALAYLHGKGFAHGRIKPGNILAIDDQLKLSSDSICREADMQIGAGKPDIFVAPETNGRATKAGDSWSLGATIVESLTQRRPEETAGDPGFPDSVPQPFLDIVRNTLRRDAKSRWTVAEISDRLNPKAAPETVETVAVVAPSPSTSQAAAQKPAPTAAPAAVAIAELPKPTPSKSSGSLSAAASAGTATAVAIAPVAVEPKAVPLAKPTKSIDPLSVPLSNVAPKFDAGKSSSKGWYIAILLLIAGAAAAWYYVPQVREFTQSVISNAPAAPPSAQPAQPTSSAPAAQPAAEPAQPPADSKPDAAPAAKPSTSAPAPTHGGIDGPPQVSSAQPPANAAPTSTPASERTPLKSAASASAPKASAALAASSIAPLPATSRTAAIASTSLPAGPVTQGAPLNQVMPEISSRARSTIHGTVRVILKVRVDASGAVQTAVPASSPSRFFSDAAVQAAKHWDFTPAKISGQPVRSEWLIRFDFSPTDTKVLPSQTKP